MEVNRHFPKPKYRFSELLKHVGDYVMTGPITYADAIRIKDAAKFWAYHHGKRIQTRKYRLPNDMHQVKVMLISQHRIREYDL